MAVRVVLAGGVPMSYLDTVDLEALDSFERASVEQWRTEGYLRVFGSSWPDDDDGGEDEDDED